MERKLLSADDIERQLKTIEGIAPSRVYFAGDNWQEYSDLPTSVRQYRTITGTFLYQNAGGCVYGTGEITQTYDAMNDAFGETNIKIRKDIAIPCTPSRSRSSLGTSWTVPHPSQSA